MENNPHVLIVGAGELGQALAGCLRKDNEVSLWDTDLTKVPDQGTRALKDMVPSADFVLLCIPSWAMRDALSNAASGLRPTTVVVALSKGMDAATGQVTGELMPQLLPSGQPFAIVGGPMLAAEIAKGLHAAAVFASPDAKVAERVAALFKSPIFMTETSTDVASISLAGVLKNVYAVALGIADGMDIDGNGKGWIAANATREMLGVAEALKMDKQAILGTAGLADFMATAYSPFSRNRAVGDEIVKKGKCDLKGEGVTSLPPLMTRLGSRAAEFPLLNVVKKIAVDCVSAAAIMEEYFAAGD